MGVAPNLQVEFGKQHRFVDVETEDADVGNIAEAAAPIYRVGCKRIVITGQDHHGSGVIAQDLRGAFEKLDRLSVIIE
jgi:hypothetical protein